MTHITLFRADGSEREVTTHSTHFSGWHQTGLSPLMELIRPLELVHEYGSVTMVANGRIELEYVD